MAFLIVMKLPLRILLILVRIIKLKFVVCLLRAKHYSPNTFHTNSCNPHNLKESISVFVFYQWGKWAGECLSDFLRVIGLRKGYIPFNQAYLSWKQTVPQDILKSSLQSQDLVHGNEHLSSPCSVPFITPGTRDAQVSRTHFHSSWSS